MLKLQYFDQLMQRAYLLEKTPMLGKTKGRRGRGTEDEMVGWHCWLKGRKFEQTLRDGEGKEGLGGHKESDIT